LNNIFLSFSWGYESTAVDRENCYNPQANTIKKYNEHKELDANRWE